MINKILNLDIKNHLWLLFARKVSRIFNIYFVPAKKKYLPSKNHPLQNLNIFFDNQYKNFKNKKFNFNKDLYRNLINNFSKNQSIKLLDFGGENIDLYLFLKEKFSKIKIYVINQPQLNNRIKNFIIKKKITNINVLTSYNKIKKLNLNYVYFGSSLQYIKNYDKILKILFKKKIKYFYISATSFFYSDILGVKIVLKQVNLLPNVLYCYSFNFRYIINLFKNNGYSVVSKKTNSYKKINFRNFPVEIDYLNILFKRKF